MRRRLWRHHLPIGGGSILLTLLLYSISASPSASFRWSVAAAYTALTLLAMALAIGPVAVLRARPRPVSSDLRRDLGIWSAVVSVVHVVIGLQVHHQGQMWLYFFRETPTSAFGLLALRRDVFGLANYLGAAATVLVVVLLALSNDRSLRWLGAARWKAWQRLSYILGALVVAHGAAYQLLERQWIVAVLVSAGMVGGVVWLQLGGRRRLTQGGNPPTTTRN